MLITIAKLILKKHQCKTKQNKNNHIIIFEIIFSSCFYMQPENGARTSLNVFKQSKNLGEIGGKIECR